MNWSTAPDRAGKMNGPRTFAIGRDNPVKRFFGVNSPLPPGRETDETWLDICERYLAFPVGASQTASGAGKER